MQPTDRDNPTLAGPPAVAANTSAAGALPADLEARLSADMKAAMKAGERDRLAVIRMLLTDVRSAGMATPPQSAEDAAAGYARKLRKGADEFDKAGDPGRAVALRDELNIVEQYLPAKADGEQTERLVAAFLAKSNYAPPQVGQAIGAFMKAHGKQVDAAEASRLIRERVAG